MWEIYFQFLFEWLNIWNFYVNWMRCDRFASGFLFGPFFVVNSVFLFLNQWNHFVQIRMVFFLISWQNNQIILHKHSCLTPINPTIKTIKRTIFFLIFFYMYTICTKRWTQYMSFRYLFGDLIKILKKINVISHSTKYETIYRINNKSIDGDKYTDNL